MQHPYHKFIAHLYMYFWLLAFIIIVTERASAGDEYISKKAQLYEGYLAVQALIRNGLDEDDNDEMIEILHHRDWKARHNSIEPWIYFIICYSFGWYIFPPSILS